MYARIARVSARAFSSVTATGLGDGAGPGDGVTPGAGAGPAGAGEGAGVPDESRAIIPPGDALTSAPTPVSPAATRDAIESASTSAASPGVDTSAFCCIASPPARRC